MKINRFKTEQRSTAQVIKQCKIYELINILRIPCITMETTTQYFTLQLYFYFHEKLILTNTLNEVHSIFYASFKNKD